MQSLDVCLILLLNAGRVAAQQDARVCYILDAILVVYGIVLTVLYCRLKMRSSGDKAFSEKREGDIYQDLGRQDKDTYDTLHPEKKKPLA
ncbi:high affinity immunoglobulin epsilon receptor subunit gamma-like [Sinocyclocheilus anshuiensis]|nr:PREDICTED: high affinity immunoglobulin epsilon receptor subunit gamma-like [Sinocyclocheilus anshuiensis]XP_016391362.1 PREDICTED: high affinity immunoglobulin epsilon receptor subunit gamma-like [Sinocyclocheilus rhinocerous]